MNANKAGLSLGLTTAIIHAGWAALVAGGMAQQFLNWILSLHFLTDTYIVQPFSIVTAGLLIAVAFAAGYIIGFIFASMWNIVQK